jgi:O-antigen ligase
VPRLRKLVWFLAVPVTASLVCSPRRLRRFLAVFAAGTGVLSLKILLGNPVRALHALRAGQAEDYTTALILKGSMTDGQRLMAGILVSLGLLLLCGRERRERGGPARAQAGGWWALMALQWAAMLLNFKRGSWLCAAGLSAVFLLVRAGWKAAGLMGALMLLTLFLPPVQDRVRALRDEWESQRGGRITMWTEIAPALIREHPWGIGYRSLTNERMRKIAPEVEPERDHLHSNVAQILVEAGWLGFCLYLAWMAAAVADAVRLARRGGGGADSLRALGAVLLMTLVGLLANGLVEYNFGDGEIVLIYGFVMGCAAGGLRAARAPCETSSGRSARSA